MVIYCGLINLGRLGFTLFLKIYSAKLLNNKPALLQSVRYVKNGNIKPLKELKTYFKWLDKKL